MNPALDEEYLTVAEAAAILRVSTSTIWRWVNQEQLPAYRIGRRKVRLKRGDLNRVVRPARSSAEHVLDEDAVIEDVRSLGPLTDKERQAMLDALDRSKQLLAEQLARRGGKPYPPSYEIIDEMRDERTRQLP